MKRLKVTTKRERKRQRSIDRGEQELLGNQERFAVDFEYGMGTSVGVAQRPGYSKRSSFINLDYSELETRILSSMTRGQIIEAGLQDLLKG